ncbi:MAG: right-handed parallel beta-helix repeat-containing protein, partial [Sphingomonadaceae bacterium]|nr:right-handed parallel beta-helix repeat-containing protein [Sphingomonadaceae bacterium]
KENYSTLIAVHAEQGHNPSAGLTIEDNVASVAPGFQWTSALVGDWSGEALVIRGNRLGERITEFERHDPR